MGHIKKNYSKIRAYEDSTVGGLGFIILAKTPREASIVAEYNYIFRNIKIEALRLTEISLTYIEGFNTLN